MSYFRGDPIGYAEKVPSQQLPLQMVDPQSVPQPSTRLPDPVRKERRNRPGQRFGAKKKSWVWSFFTQDAQDPNLACCEYCGKVVRRLPSDKGSPKKLNEHLKTHKLTRDSINTTRTVTLDSTEMPFEQSAVGGGGEMAYGAAFLPEASVSVPRPVAHHPTLQQAQAQARAAQQIRAQQVQHAQEVQVQQAQQDQVQQSQLVQAHQAPLVQAQQPGLHRALHDAGELREQPAIHGNLAKSAHMLQHFHSQQLHSQQPRHQKLVLVPFQDLHGLHSLHHQHIHQLSNEPVKRRFLSTEFDNSPYSTMKFHKHLMLFLSENKLSILTIKSRSFQQLVYDLRSDSVTDLLELTGLYSSLLEVSRFDEKTKGDGLGESKGGIGNV